MIRSELDLNYVDEIVVQCGTRREAVVPILQAIQRHYRYLPQPALMRVCELTEITPADITGVSTFYTHFRHQPVGRHVIHVCEGTACHVKGAELVRDAVALHLGLAPGQDTDARGEFTLQSVACLGCCTLAPVVQIDDVTYGRVSPRSVPQMVAEERHARSAPPAAARPAPNSRPGELGEIRIGLGSCCQAQGSGRVHDEILAVLSESGAPAAVKRVGCIGMCHQTPLVQLITPAGESRFFSHVRPEDVRSIVLRHFRPPGLVRRLGYRFARWLDAFYSNEADDAVESHALDVGGQAVCGFLGPQKHIATECCGDLDPLDLDEYLRHDGFAALRRCLRELDPPSIVDEVRRSGLRGRGGGGFPTYIKWQKARAAAGDTKYVVCNGDEGDPGAFMDRMLLESFPYRVIEGMAIAALAIGAQEAIFYIRDEYPLAVARIREALERCEQHALIGAGILGSGLNVKFRVAEGAGAFICGEETALINSLEGRRGTPTLRPPYPVETGLWDRPTLINNVETLACLPWIFRHGGDQFAQLGTGASKGTKVFALAGKVVRGGLIEVAMGITLRQIVYDIGGGALPGRTFKAVQVGGPSGGCVPASLADTPVDYEALVQVGAIMGSGGLVVLDNTDCMVDIARYFLRFTQEQSCGKCTLCRIGTKRMLEIMDRICTGQGRPGDLEQLEQLAHSVAAGSICGLGKTAPNPVLSTLKYFRDEYEAHLQGKCPAGKCAALIRYEINQACIGCTLCAQHCPVHAIPLTPYRRHAVNMDLCTRCDTCRQVCPMQAVDVVS
ncbi:MAG: 4Fe-4S dicluster domain-containing protein [Planctomycetaceae bacterium]|nr:4Fe-4S dicluster domain-containing protein [Planctomycetaceae bacterium]